MATVYRVGVEPAALAPAHGRTFALEELQGVVGGYVEAIPLDASRLLLCNEDGIQRKLPLNLPATAVLHEARPEYRGTVVRGDALVCTRAEMD